MIPWDESKYYEQLGCYRHAVLVSTIQYRSPRIPRADRAPMKTRPHIAKPELSLNLELFKWGVRFRLRFRAGSSKEFSVQLSFHYDVSAETR